MVVDKLLLLDPKPGDLSKTRLLKTDRTVECCIILRRVLERGEIPIVPGYCWFSTETYLSMTSTQNL